MADIRQVARDATTSPEHSGARTPSRLDGVINLAGSVVPSTLLPAVPDLSAHEDLKASIAADLYAKQLAGLTGENGLLTPRGIETLARIDRDHKISAGTLSTTVAAGNSANTLAKQRSDALGADLVRAGELSVIAHVVSREDAQAAAQTKASVRRIVGVKQESVERREIEDINAREVVEQIQRAGEHISAQISAKANASAGLIVTEAKGAEAISVATKIARVTNRRNWIRDHQVVLGLIALLTTIIVLLIVVIVASRS